MPLHRGLQAEPTCLGPAPGLQPYSCSPLGLAQHVNPCSVATHPSGHLLAILSDRPPEPSTPRFCPPVSLAPSKAPLYLAAQAKHVGLALISSCLSPPRTSAVIIPDLQAVLLREPLNWPFLCALPLRAAKRILEKRKKKKA